MSFSWGPPPLCCPECQELVEQVDPLGCLVPGEKPKYRHKIRKDSLCSVAGPNGHTVAEPVPCPTLDGV